MRLLVREAAHLRALPPRVGAFYARAWWTALRSHDRFTLDSATRPSHTRRLLALARGSGTAVELGTGTAWTTAALAAATRGGAWSATTPSCARNASATSR